MFDAVTVLGLGEERAQLAEVEEENERLAVAELRRKSNAEGGMSFKVRGDRMGNVALIRVRHAPRVERSLSRRMKELPTAGRSRVVDPTRKGLEGVASGDGILSAQVFPSAFLGCFW